jgi:hypothetical protein
MGIFGSLFGGGEKQFKMQGGAKAIIVGRDESEPGGEWVKVKVVDTPYGKMIPREHGGIGAVVKVKKEWIMASNKEIEKQLKRVEKNKR